MEAEAVAIQCWKAYIESHDGKAPQKNADFQHWLRDSSTLRHVAENIANSDTDSDEEEEYGILVTSELSISQLSPPITPIPHIAHEFDKKTTAKPSQKYASSTEHLTLHLPKINSIHSEPTLLCTIPTVTNIIKPLSVSPKDVPDIMPKTELQSFLALYDINDLKYKLDKHKIGLMQLESVDTDDLNELCSYLQLTITEKIRFKCAVRDLQQKGTKTSPSTTGGYNYAKGGLIQSQSDELSFGPALVSLN